ATFARHTSGTRPTVSESVTLTSSNGIARFDAATVARWRFPFTMTIMAVASSSLDRVRYLRQTQESAATVVAWAADTVVGHACGEAEGRQRGPRGGGEGRRDHRGVRAPEGLE